MKITAVERYLVQVPIKMIADGGIAPYAGSQDKAGVTTAQSLLLCIRTDEGVSGWGEMNTGFEPGVDNALVDSWIAPTLIGQDPRHIRTVMATLDAPYWPQFSRQALACAVEMALWDLVARSMDRPVSALLGGTVRSHVPLAFCIGVTDAEVGAESAVRAFEQGYTVLKTKIGIDFAADVARIHAMVDATGGGLKLRLDANQGYNRVEALRMLRELDGLPVEYVEQPLAVGDFAGMRALRERTTVPLAINEDAYVPGGVARGIAEEAIDAAVVDIEPAVGVSGLLELAALGRAYNIPLAHHCGWDFGVKAAMMAQVVGAIPALNLASDSTYPMHLDDVLVERLDTTGARMRVPTGPGIGIDVDEAAVQRLRIG